MTIRNLWAGSLIALAAGAAFAAVTAEEAKQLGTTLTLTGAERAGNADKTIPEYTGGLTTPPASYVKGSGIRPDAFPNEKPLFSIKAADVAKYDAKLTFGTKELLKRYPNTMRLDVYPTHRTVAVPKYVQDNTVKNATSAKTTKGGDGIEGTYAGYPFPIPKTGHEVMWNHLLRFVSTATVSKYDSINVDGAGKAVLATTAIIAVEYPYYDPKRTTVSNGNDIYFRTRVAYSAPARRNGEALLVQDYVDQISYVRKAWQYLPGQRRVKQAPDVGYDTPNPGAAGMATYDEAWVFAGAMDRFDWKLIGKKEMYVPYNVNRLTYAKDPYATTTPGHLNPDFVRWELHRVWVVEATLKADKRHIYSKRIFYVDEDSWANMASDQYDARGNLYRSGFIYLHQMPEVPAPNVSTQSFHDFNSGGYNIAGLFGAYEHGMKIVPLGTDTEWSPDALAGAGVR